MEKPPLDLYAEVIDAQGMYYRWAPEAPRVADVPRGISLSTKRFEGFERQSCQLSRPIDRDWPDLGLFDSFALVGYDGTVAYEGRLSSQPRTSPDTIQVETLGWMTHARQKKFREIYVDPDFGSWGEPPANRRAQTLLGGGVIAHYTTSADSGSLSFNGEAGTQIPDKANAQLWYDAGPGLSIGKVMYRGTQQNTTSVEAATLFTDDNDAMLSAVSTALTLDDTVRTASPTVAERYGMIRAIATATHTPAAAAAFARTFTRMVVYGNSGVSTHPISGECDGIYASEAMQNILSRFCPKLVWAGNDTTHPIPYVVFRDRTYPYEAIERLNAPHLWEFDVYEDRKFRFYPADLTDYDWEVRTTDPGTEVSLQGDSTEDLANGIVVSFTNSRTGQADEVSPDTHPDELTDPSVENPANTHGEDVWTEISLSIPADTDTAVQIGRASLAEFNSPKAPGTIVVTGHIRDRAGHWQQGWKPRSSETVAITNFPNDRPRLMTETTWDQDQKKLTITVEGVPRRMDAFVDRIETALKARNLIN